MNQSYRIEWCDASQASSFMLTDRSILIGRSRACDLCLTHRSISRRHASLERTPFGFTVEDLHSSTGTQVNGSTIKPGQPYSISTGDTIKVGKQLLTFKGPNDQESRKQSQEVKISPSQVQLYQQIELFRAAVMAQIKAETLTDQASFNSVFEQGLSSLQSFVDGKLQEYLIMQEINHIIGKILNLNDLLSTALELVSKVLNADRGFVLLYEPEQKKLVPMVDRHFGGLQDASVFDLNFSQTIADSCFQSGEIVLIEDAMDHDVYRSAHSIIATKIRSVACIPLMQEREVSGVIYLDNLKEAGCFHSHQREFMMTFSRQTTIALENARLYTQAVTDDLTGLYERKYVEKRILEEMMRCERYNRAASLIMIDIDHFKNVNDTYGHQGGDAVLMEISRLMLEMARKSDIVGRYGGEEFIMLLPETHEAGALVFAERLRKQVEKRRVSYQDRNIQITASFGVSCYKKAFKLDIYQLVDAADRALYRAKELGRNQVIIDADWESKAKTVI